ncbi:MAG TPA: hypothetical protein VFB72_12685 [Verrucomicrobiae bacterium]|nr:hypothetical protein [Verrucomicrobiae bacterium]
MQTRREFFIACTALAVTSSIKPGIALGAPLHIRDMRLEEVSFRDFAANVNTPFLVSQESRMMTALQLAEAKLFGTGGFAAASSAEDAQNEKFSLLFVGEKGAELLSGTYDFENEGIGRFQMFITPVGPEQPGSCCYQAVFNRPAPKGDRAALADNREFRH